MIEVLIIIIIVLFTSWSIKCEIKFNRKVIESSNDEDWKIK